MTESETEVQIWVGDEEGEIAESGVSGSEAESPSLSDAEDKSLSDKVDGDTAEDTADEGGSSLIEGVHGMSLK